MGPAALKLYDKRGRVVRVESRTNDVTFFRHHREVVHRGGTSEMNVAPVKNTIYTMPVLRDFLEASNVRVRSRPPLAEPRAA